LCIPSESFKQICHFSCKYAGCPCSWKFSHILYTLYSIIVEFVFQSKARQREAIDQRLAALGKGQSFLANRCQAVPRRALHQPLDSRQASITALYVMICCVYDFHINQNMLHSILDHLLAFSLKKGTPNQYFLILLQVICILKAHCQYRSLYCSKSVDTVLCMDKFGFSCKITSF
jgi:hypothetical protein